LKTTGSKLTKLNIEGKLTYTFYTDVEPKGDKLEYSFITQNDGSTTARSPEGAFEFRIDNDLQAVTERIRQFEN
jgi:hypothetical protein